MRRAPGNVEIDRHDAVRAVVHFGSVRCRARRQIAQAPTAMTSFGAGTAS